MQACPCTLRGDERRALKRLRGEPTCCEHRGSAPTAADQTPAPEAPPIRAGPYRGPVPAATPSVEAADDSDELALDSNVVVELGRVVGVGGLEPDAALLLVERLER